MKLRYSLIPVEALAEWARVYTIGAMLGKEKIGVPDEIMRDSLMRHFEADRAGEPIDKDGFFHLAACMFYCGEMLKKRLEERAAHGSPNATCQRK
jgi:hypothetical protein